MYVDKIFTDKRHAILKYMWQQKNVYANAINKC